MTGAALIAAALVLAGATTAGADSIVYVKDSNVWIANPDGSGAYQVTLDGTQANPYETPSQSDDATILAVREPPGGRRQLVRMRQNGELLNPPINTPAPGTGAIDAKISPDGRLVAYWFATTVNDPLCTYCVNVSNRVLLSYSDRFTGADEVGTPNTGGWPSWLSNDTITLGSGSPTQWYYKLGMPEAAQWFADSDLTGEFQTLLDAEVAPSGDRLAVVRGDNQESIFILKMNGAPPAKPTIANAACDGVVGASGKFVDPTWSANGTLLAWQEDDGVWTMSAPADLADCSGFGTPMLRVPGARNPDLSPAAINPGARPGCGNPGNPAACPAPGPGPVCRAAACPGPGPGPGPGVDARTPLTTMLKSAAAGIKKLRISGLIRRRHFKVTFQAPAAGLLTVQLGAGGKKLGSGRKRFAAAGRASLNVSLTKKGLKKLRRARRLRVTLKATFAPTVGTATTVSQSAKLRR